ncbi:MAG: peptidoglycan DD-metalloendopeptidase family protein [Lachnospiraceae bacterium]|nr:peptidoglycan DD-metalloendopeptidase family protein [Lachnospiraceae bacterium]
MGNAVEQTVPDSDLDYDPYFQETNSSNVENPDLSGSASMSDGVMESEVGVAETENTLQALAEEAKRAEDVPVNETVSEEGTAGDDAPAISTAMQPTLNFEEGDALVWPVVGNVLINYSMDKTIYFPTLDQYKYNPAIVIQANEGDVITAAAAGKVTEVYEDAQIGTAVVMELGNGYEVTYGQLSNVLVSEGSYVSMGDMIAQVAAPSKYYSVEGTNVYFKLTKDGEPVNPMTCLK